MLTSFLAAVSAAVLLGERNGLPFFSLPTFHIDRLWIAVALVPLVLGIGAASILMAGKDKEASAADRRAQWSGVLYVLVVAELIPAVMYWKGWHGLPLQPFGIVVAAGVLIGAEVLRRYGLKFGMDEDDIRQLTLWVIVTGFIGAHLFDTLVYEHERLSDDPILILKVWDGISSYGGFIGGIMGYAFFVWWKRLTPGLVGDTGIVGLLVAFTIGRIGCTIVHDHVGRATTSVFGVDYPREEISGRRLIGEFPGAGDVIRAHNVAMYELVYLALVCAIVLPLAFSKRRYPAGFLAVLVGLFYAPVRFFLEYWRLNSSDPRYMSLTFAQWASLVAFAAAAYAAVRLWQTGVPAPLPDELGGRPGGRLATLAAMAKAKAKAA